MQDNLLAESWTYQKILKEGREEGKLEGLQEAVLDVVEARFPPLVEFARQRVTKASKPDVVSLVLKGVAMAPNEDAARLLLELLAA